MLRDCHEIVTRWFSKGFSDACMGNDWASGFGLGTTRHVEDMDWVAFCFEVYGGLSCFPTWALAGPIVDSHAMRMNGFGLGTRFVPCIALDLLAGKH